MALGRRWWLWCGLLSAALPAPVMAWGGEAHRIICEITWQRLSPEVRSWIGELRAADKQPLGTFAESCVWADHVRDTTHRDTYHYHFVNIPPGSEGVDLQRDCPTDKRCAPWAVHFYSSILQNNRQPRPARAEALKFLAHFVGDLHQPMHTGRLEDRGGNKVFIDFFGQYGSCRKAREGRALSLHDAWDDLIIERAGWRWRVDGPRLAAAIDGEQARRWADSTVLEWTNESYRLCEDYACTIEPEVRHCSGTIPFKKIDQPYFDRARKDAEAQFQKAGVRLAQMIEKAAARDR